MTCGTCALVGHRCKRCGGFEPIKRPSVLEMKDITKAMAKLEEQGIVPDSLICSPEQMNELRKTLYGKKVIQK